MTTAYEFCVGYTKLGIGTAPSSAPTITVVDSANNVLVTAATAVTALTNLVGGFRYSYSGADGLTCYALFHTTDATVDQQDLFTLAVINPVIRDIQVQLGTAGAGLTAIPNSAGVTSILSDYARRTGDYSTVAALTAAKSVIDSIYADMADVNDILTPLATKASASSLALIPTNTASASSVAAIPVNSLLDNDARIPATIIASASQVASISDTSASTIWSYATRELTNISASTIAAIPTNTASASSVAAIPVNPLLTNDARIPATAIASASQVATIPVNPLLTNDARIPATVIASASQVATIPVNPLLTNDARIPATVIASASQVASISSGAGTSASTIWEYASRTLTAGSYVSGSGTTPADIWSYGTRELTNISASTIALIPTNPLLTNDVRIPDMIASASLVSAITGTSASTVWTYSTRTITSASGLDLASASSMALIPTNTASASTVASIQSVTNQMVFTVPNKIDSSATISGSIINVTSASEIWTYGTRELTSATPSVSASTIASAVWDETVISHAIPGTTGSTLSKLDTSVSTRTTLGTGFTNKEYTVFESDGITPISDVTVEVYTDVNMTNIIASGITNAFGHVYFDLNSGTYYLRRLKNGWNFVNPDTEVMP